MMESKIEVAKQIFAEIEEKLQAMFKDYVTARNPAYACVVETVARNIEAVKKKYTEGGSNG